MFARLRRGNQRRAPKKKSVKPKSRSADLWLLATGRIVHWQFVGLDEPGVIKSLLVSSGCQEQPVQQFTNVRLELFLCNANSMASVRSLDIEKKYETQSFR
jgi:hypothetical protein